VQYPHEKLTSTTSAKTVGRIAEADASSTLPSTSPTFELLTLMDDRLSVASLRRDYVGHSRAPAATAVVVAAPRPTGDAAVVMPQQTLATIRS
jgi:hypothetical protein